LIRIITRFDFWPAPNICDIQGAITYVPLVATDYWRINMQSMSIGNTAVLSSPMNAILDTGTTLLVGPANLISKVSSFAILKFSTVEPA
jgi:hypothetical protein